MIYFNICTDRDIEYILHFGGIIDNTVLFTFLIRSKKGKIIDELQY